MLISIFKRNKTVREHYFKIYDIRGVKIKLTLSILLIIFIYSLLNPAISGYLSSIKEQIALKSVDQLFDYTIPLLSALVIFLVFYNDYKNYTYQFYMFLNKRKFNDLMFIRYWIYILIFCLGSFIIGLFYYRNMGFLNLTDIWLSIRFIPNILFLSSFLLCMISLTKNAYFGLFMTLTYFIGDLLSDARLFKIFSLGANTNNFLYNTSLTYYLANRLILVVLSIVFLYLACRNRRIR